jgi:hypothetical protein
MGRAKDLRVESMFGFSSPGLKRIFLYSFSSFFGHVAPAIFPQKVKKYHKNLSFLPPA